MENKQDAARERTSEADVQVASSPQYQEALERFILFWGEMASNWGINRTMAQIHALLYCAEEPLDTDEIMEQLQISRGNANMNLRSLINWNLVRKVHLAGSRKDFYAAEKDVWEITAHIIREREKREIRPVMQQLRDCQDILKSNVAEAETCGDLPQRDAQLCERIESLIQLMEVFEGFSHTLLPFVQKRNLPMMKQLIRIAENLQVEEEK